MANFLRADFKDGDQFKRPSLSSRLELSGRIDMIHEIRFVIDTNVLRTRHDCLEIPMDEISRCCLFFFSRVLCFVVLRSDGNRARRQ